MESGAFIFERYEFRSETGELRLRYAYENGLTFEETLTFPTGGRPLTPDEQPALDAAFRLIFLLAGVSYAKAFAPARMTCTAFDISPATAALVEKVYHQGLGEFAYRNRLDLENRLRFSSAAGMDQRAAPLDLPHRLLVPVGGGKDSIVTVETLRNSGAFLTLFALQAPDSLAAPIAATIETAALPALCVKRRLSPALIELNKTGVYNGHVPITAILCSIAIATALLHGFDTVVMSNEHSASAPNLILNGEPVNHQYSKSFGFEMDFSAYVAAHISPTLSCFSLLRPLTEAAIAQRFAKFEKYHAVFRSCNTAFRQDAAARGTAWCGQCPKCRFVFLALAPFMEKNALVKIFGRNLLDDPSQRGGYAELCGLQANKPFECVGEVAESALLMERLFRAPAWKNDAVVNALGTKLAAFPKDFEKVYKALFAFSPDHQVPESYLRLLSCA